jgi:membrane protein
VRRLVERLWRYGMGISRSFSRHAGSQLSAAIAYRVLFSLVPFAALLLTIVDAVLPESRGEQFVDWLFGFLPGDDLANAVGNTLEDSGASAPIVALVALATLLWTASGMMASIRIAFRVIWDRESGPAYVRSKLRDFALVGFAGVLILAAFGLSVVVRIVVASGASLAERLGWSGDGGFASTAVEVTLSTIVVFVALLALYRAVPPETMRLRLLWPSATAAAIAFEVVVYGYAVYATRFADFSTVYGPIGAVFLFLLLVYLLGAIVLLGAETAAARSRRSAQPPPCAHPLRSPM